jgi:hypothetical protein
MQQSMLQRLTTGVLNVEIHTVLLGQQQSQEAAMMMGCAGLTSATHHPAPVLGSRTTHTSILLVAQVQYRTHVASLRHREDYIAWALLSDFVKHSGRLQQWGLSEISIRLWR